MIGPHVGNDEPYDLLELLGSGGFAQTYKARVLDDDLVDEFGTDIVAIKIPLSRKKERILRRELEMNALLHAHLRKSTNLVKYLGFSIFNKQIVMAMEYISGGSLRKIIGDLGKQKPLPIQQAVLLTEGILVGLITIHNEHVFHRDIKPENILMDGNTPKIADLGISRLLDSNELASTTTGTIYYMSPEILLTEGATFTSDIWSLGVMLYEMATGKLPFGGSQKFGGGDMPMGKVLLEIRRAEPTPPCQLRPEISKPLNEFILKSLQRNPKDRFENASAMLTALKAISCRNVDEKLENELASIHSLLRGLEPPLDLEERLKYLSMKHQNEPRIFQYLGEFYIRCQRYSDAIVTFKKGIEISPENSLLHWHIGTLLQSIGQKPDADWHLQHAINLGLDDLKKRHAQTLLRLLQRG